MNHLHSHHEDHGHDEKDDKFKSQLVGLSIGLMAVMVAVCAALGNTERNLMTQDLIKQAQATSKESGASVKLRIVLLDLQKFTAIPKEKRPQELVSSSLNFYKDYKAERDLAYELAESMEPLVESHLEGTDKYEAAQLFAEIAIAIASISVLIRNRFVWYLALLVFFFGLFKLSYAKYTVNSQNYALEQKITPLEKQFVELREQHKKNEADKRIISELDPTANSTSVIRHN